MTDEQRRSEILKAEEAIRALAKELGSQSEMLKRFDGAKDTLNESKGAILQATNVLQETMSTSQDRIGGLEQSFAAHNRRFDSIAESILKATSAIQQAVNGSQERIGNLEELFATQGQRFDSITESQRRNALLVRWALVCSGAINGLALLVFLLRIFSRS